MTECDHLKSILGTPAYPIRSHQLHHFSLSPQWWAKILSHQLNYLSIKILFTDWFFHLKIKRWLMHWKNNYLNCTTKSTTLLNQYLRSSKSVWPQDAWTQIAPYKPTCSVVICVMQSMLALLAGIYTVQYIDEHMFSVIGKHLRNFHKVNIIGDLTNNFSVLKKCNGKQDCLIYEMLFIRKNKPSQNTICLKYLVYLFRNIHSEM